MNKEIDRIKGILKKMWGFYNVQDWYIETIESDLDTIRKEFESVETLISTKGALNE